MGPKTEELYCERITADQASKGDLIAAIDQDELGIDTGHDERLGLLDNVGPGVTIYSRTLHTATGCAPVAADRPLYRALKDRRDALIHAEDMERHEAEARTTERGAGLFHRTTFDRTELLADIVGGRVVPTESQIAELWRVYVEGCGYNGGEPSLTDFAAWMAGDTEAYPFGCVVAW